MTNSSTTNSAVTTSSAFTNFVVRRLDIARLDLLTEVNEVETTIAALRAGLISTEASSSAEAA